MKIFLPAIGIFGLAVLPVLAAATALQAMDGGGRRAGGAHVVADQSVGGIVGISTAAPPTAAMRHGYVGQLTDLTGFAVQMETNAIDEGGSQQLDGIATCDDDTALAVAGTEVAWDAAIFPLRSISPAGVAAATNVYEDTPATVAGRYQGCEGAGNFTVRDVDDDNFDTYAGDGLPDGWQVDHFGIGNPEAGPTNNVDGDPFDNTGEWLADTIPTDEDSYFRLTVITNIPPDVSVAFDSSSARRYSLETSTNLAASNWVPVVGQTNLPGNDGERWLTDSNVPAAGHYRVTVKTP